MFDYRGMKRLGILLIFFLVGFGSLSAQTFKEIKVNDKLASQKGTILAELRANPSNINNFEKFLSEYYLARWTVQSNARDLHRYRLEINEDSLGLADQSKKAFFQMITRQLSTFARSGEYYPACRYNAILAIGEFNEAPATGNTAEVPYPGVLKGLCIFVDSNELTVPDYVRLGALLGLVRHTNLGIKDEAQKNTIIDILLGILSPKFAADKKLSPNIHLWFKLKALEALDGFRSPKGPKSESEILDALRLIIEDENEDIEVRSIAARAIGNMNFSSLKQYDYLGLARSLSYLALHFTAAELRYIEIENIRDQVKGNNAPSAMGPEAGMGPPPGMDTPPGMGPPPGGGPDLGMDMGMGMPPEMGGQPNVVTMDTSTINKVRNIIGRIKFDFNAVCYALTGPEQKTGVRAALSTDQHKDVISLLDKIIDDIEKLNTFLDNGIPDPNAPVAKTSRRKTGRKKQPTGPPQPKVTIPEIKEYLEDQEVRFKEMLETRNNI